MANLTRRGALLTGASLAGSSIAGSSLAASMKPSPALALNLDDPTIALNTYVKLRGSTAEETVFQVYNGDIFTVADGQPPFPLLGFTGIQKSHWHPHADVGYVNEDYDVGFYVDHESREILEYWDNPLTGKTVEVFHYRGGPSGGHFRLGADGGDVYGGLDGRWSVVGNQLWHTSTRWGSRRNPLQPEDWPQASSGEMILGSMSQSHTGSVDDVLNPDVSQAPAMQIWTNTVSWMPWMQMGQRPGFNTWHWIGAKGVNRDNLDPKLVAAVEEVWPGYVSRDAVWQEPISGRTEYMRIKQGKPLPR